MLRDLRVRDRCFPAGMFRDYRWQALLILFIADAEQRDVRFLDLFTEIGAPHTTGKRIVDELEQKTERSVMVSSVHKVLLRLEEKGYLESRMGGATKTRGGRDKRLYTLTEAGKKALHQSRELRNGMWKEIPKIVWQG
jgi:DNA-binding MarR family transcriptional regulator